MKLARSRCELVLGIILLAVLICLWAVFTDERLSKQLDEVDATYEEQYQVDFAPGAHNAMNDRRLP